MSLTQSLFAGRLSINGVPTGAPDSQATSPYQKLKTGLRVDSGPVADSQTASAREATGEAVASAASVGSSDQTTVGDKFNAEMTARLKAANPNNPQAAEILAESLTATAEEIKNKFGQDKANEFMSRILTATDAGVRENDLTAATSSFFKNLAGEATANPELAGKLNAIRDFLNQGLAFIPEADTDQDQSESGSTVEAASGLSTALNQYFGQKALVAEDGQSVEAKGFDTNFDRVTLQIARQTATDGGGAAENWIILRDPNNVNPADVSVDESTWHMVADHLRTAVGNEKAAAFFENGTGNLFEAAAASVAVVAEENGQEAAYGFVEYLNENVAQGLESSGFSFQGWSLGRDYSQPEGPAAGPPLTPKDGRLWFGDSEMDDIIQNRQHQGLLTNWKYTDPQSGASAIRAEAVDLNEIYARQQAGSTAGTKLNNPAGNLVDTMA